MSISARRRFSFRRPFAFASVLLLATAARLAAQGTDARAADATPAMPAPGPVAFVDVNVVPMDQERVLEHQTVIVRDGKIAAMGPARSTSVPAGARRVDGRGKYLLPGLAEMHAHIPGANAPEQLIRDIMFLYVANGVTTIRGMLGAPNQLALREQTAKGELLGPTIFVGAPSLNGQSAASPAAAAVLVREHERAGYDFLKLHPGIPRASYDTIVKTAREVGITWAGHISQEVGLEHTLATRQSTIDHLDGYLEASVDDAMRARIESPTDQVTYAEVIRAVRDDKIREAAEKTKAAGVWNVPTAFLWESFNSPEPPEEMLKRPEMKYATPNQRAGWANQKRQIMQNPQQQALTPDDVAKLLQSRRKILKALSDAGAGLLMGTDSPQMFNVPGFALHREIAVMQESGLTPYQVLVSGTRNVATYAARDLKLDGHFGTVAVGNRADLMLLDANPLADVANIAKRSGVMVRGRWLDRAEIEKGLGEIEGRNRGG